MFSYRANRVRLKTQWANSPQQQGSGPVDFAFQPSVSERKLRELVWLAFLECKEKAPLIGPPGVGKTRLAIALYSEAIVASLLCHHLGPGQPVPANPDWS